MMSARGSSLSHAELAGPSRGFTLAELLTVIGIIAVLGGASLGVFMRMPARLTEDGADASVRTLLRRTRAAATFSRAPAEVEIDGGRLEGRSWLLVALFRFEDVPQGVPSDDAVTLGARGQKGRVRHARADVGRIGNALFFEEPGACVDLGTLPAFDARRGIRIDAWVLPGDLAELRRNPTDGGARHAPAPGRLCDDPYLFQVVGKGDSYYLRVREDYALLGGIRGADARAARERTTPPGKLAPGRWAEVSLVYDGEDLSLLVDGLREDIPGKDRDDWPRFMAISGAPLMISSPDSDLTFFGGIDEVRVSVVSTEETVELPDWLTLDAPPSVRFGAGGVLDPVQHSGRLVLTIYRKGTAKGSPSSRVIEIEPSGAVR